MVTGRSPLCGGSLRRRIPATLHILVLAAVAAGGAQAGPDPEGLLRRSESADTRVDYVGVKTLKTTSTRHGAGEERTVRIYHRAPDQTRIEFVEGGPQGAAIVQRADRYYMLGPGARPRRMPPRNPPGRMDLLLENYRVRHLRFERVAGRGAAVLAIEPKFPGNPKKTVWIDPRTGLTLKSQVFSASGELREESAFTEIDMHPTSFASYLFEVPNGAEDLAPPRPVQLDFVARRPKYLPPGYILVSTSSMIDRRGRVVHYMRYTDGLNTLSVFEAKASGDTRTGLVRDAAVSGVVGDLLYAIAGDMSVEELRKLADSLER